MPPELDLVLLVARTQPQDGDILLLRTRRDFLAASLDEAVEKINKWLDERDLGVLVLVVDSSWSVERLVEEQMHAAGWMRRPSSRRVDAGTGRTT